METAENILNTLILPHWPFFAWLVTAMMIGQVMKTAVWTKERALQKGKAQWVFWWGYKTLAIHPVVSGALVGLAWREPEEGMTKLPASMAYFALAGACSVFAYEMLRGFAKSKGVDLTMPGESTMPSAALAVVAPAEPAELPKPASPDESEPRP